MKRERKNKRLARKFNLNGYIFGALRKIWRWYPERRKALEVANVEKDKFQCEYCKKLFIKKDVHVDHIDPVIDPEVGFISWDDYVSRLFVDSTYLQVLCKQCHKEKSSKENKKRRKKNGK